MSMPVFKSAPSLGLKSEVVVFTPVIAQTWLEHSQPNRQIVQGVVGQYARVMRAGGWRLNGEPIIVDNHGLLMNGQHRLRAVIEADVTVPMLVVSGVSSENFPTIDTGRSRLGRDVLSINGFPEPMTLAAAAMWMWKYERSGGSMTTVKGSEAATNAELLDVLSRHPRLPDSLPYGISLKRLMGRGLATFCHYLFAQRDLLATNQYFEALAKGENLTDGQAAYVLRESLISNRQSKRKLSQTYILAIMIRGFNYERAGRLTRNVRWRQRGPTREAFPVLD